ncbi:DUF4404 family protein [Roseimaritima ulvae]|uniref:DUF4404 domain-containing protein n=1 Tax=Roseimaritima ulvae TaxID=980254 RepID=A0A5B9R8S9_9BACT|nr:DUF4404 family protein [Roseimaritima ulvae]QEG43281.1 hypothetical protein UC8_53280 [Roseimaritima ulvae]
MTNERLNALLTALHAELESAETLDEQQAAQLKQTLDELKEKLPEEEAESGLVSRLRESAQQFEETHPQLTHTIGSLADALAQIGI